MLKKPALHVAHHAQPEGGAQGNFKHNQSRLKCICIKFTFVPDPTHDGNPETRIIIKAKGIKETMRNFFRRPQGTEGGKSEIKEIAPPRFDECDRCLQLAA